MVMAPRVGRSAKIKIYDKRNAVLLRAPSHSPGCSADLSSGRSWLRFCARDCPVARGRSCSFPLSSRSAFARLARGPLATRRSRPSRGHAWSDDRRPFCSGAMRKYSADYNMLMHYLTTVTGPPRRPTRTPPQPPLLPPRPPQQTTGRATLGPEAPRLAGHRLPLDLAVSLGSPATTGSLSLWAYASYAARAAASPGAAAVAAAAPLPRVSFRPALAWQARCASESETLTDAEHHCRCRCHDWW
jgi:hypothetical protein